MLGRVLGSEDEDSDGNHGSIVNGCCRSVESSTRECHDVLKLNLTINSRHIISRTGTHILRIGTYILRFNSSLEYLTLTRRFLFWTTQRISAGIATPASLGCCLILNKILQPRYDRLKLRVLGTFVQQGAEKT